MRPHINVNRLYRDERRRKVSGVCAGIAKHFDVEPWIPRVAALVSFCFMPIPTAIAYVLAVLLIPIR